MKTDILFIAPTPPPYAGPEVCSQLFLNSRLGEKYSIRHVRSNISMTNRGKGEVGIRKVISCIPFFIKLVFYLIKDRPKLVYSLLAQNKTGFVRDAIIIMLCRLFRKKVVVHLHGGNFADFYARSSPIFRNCIRSVLNSVDILILLGERLKKQFVSILPEKNIRVLYNAVNVKEFNGKKSHSDQSISVLYVGHLSYAKGFCDMLKAIPLVLEKKPQAQFVFAGERIDNERNILRDETGSRIDFQDMDGILSDVSSRFSSQLRFLGIISGETKIETFLGADVFVLPSYSEGFPMVVLEAMAAELPVITTPVGVLPEVFDDGVNGFFVNPGDHHALANRLIQLIENAGLRMRMGRRNSEYITANFSIEVIAEKLGDIFAGVLE